MIPRDYNAAEDLVGRNLVAGRGGKVAFIDDTGQCTYAELAVRINRFGNGLKSLGLGIEDRVMLAMLDCIEWPVAFLGAIRAGIIPIATNTLLTTKDYEFMLGDSRAKVLIVSEALLPAFAPLLGKFPFLKHVIVAGKPAAGQLAFADVLAKGAPDLAPAPTTCDDACFWLYSSGSTGTPKGTVHVQSSMIMTAELYAKPVLGIREDDVVYSAAKFFFAYGLGNSLTFPMAVGATAVITAERPTPDSVFKRIVEKQPTIFYGVPTLYAALLASPAFPQKGAHRLRVCTSAGEALPADIGKRWSEKTGTEVLDGIGSTEMLHIFMSNSPGEVRYGTSGKPVPGYKVKVADDAGNPVKVGEVGDLYINGPTSATQYWNQREKSRATFQGEWTKSGDKYAFDEAGYFTYAGRSDDMLKVSGIYVSPVEVEAALISHEAVLEAAVVGADDENKLTKPKAFVVLKPGATASVEELQAFVKGRLAPYKYPRWVEFVKELPKTATGKIQRFKLRG
ncbi:MAG: benzoate-CoA ligase family protein [Betaproteobacteria bacterium]|nr:benzoate-CoA ligase family protein [Betaproteobacteria bacterium]